MIRPSHHALAASLLTLAACSGGAPDPAAPTTTATAHGAAIAIVGVTVIDPGAKDAAAAKLAEQTVLVRGDRIAAIGPWSRVRVPEGAATVDGRGRFLIPGLVDMHVHLVHEEDLSLYVAEGITSVRNMWGAPIHLAWRDEIQRGQRLGPTIRTVGPIVDGKDPAHDGSFVALTPADADRAITLHRRLGYDIVKAYSKLEPAVFERLAVSAHAAGLEVVGHVPREVGLLRSLDLGLTTVEHTNTFYDALQADDSPVKGKTDRASRQQWIDHLDESKLGGIADRFLASHAAACPTRIVMSGWEPKDRQLARLERPEVKKYVAPSELAVWRPDRDPPEQEQQRNARELVVADAIVRTLHQKGVRILAGTDVGNPLIVPGFGLHDELGELVRIGLSPLDALRAATRDAAAALHREEIGTLAPAKRADLVLLGGDPLANIAETRHVEGVMVRGHWIDATERARLLGGVEAWARGDGDPFAKRPPLGGDGTELFAARYRVHWKDTPFDTERLRVLRDASGKRVLIAEAYDPHQGEWLRMTLAEGDSGRGEHLVLEAEGATGRGRVDITRSASALHVEGTLLSGDVVKTDIPIDPEAYLVPDHFLAARLVLPTDAKREVAAVGIALGSTVDTTPAKWKLAPVDGAPGRLEIDTGKGKPGTLEVDPAGGAPKGFSMPSHGAMLEWRRLP